MAERLVDVLDRSGAVLHTYPIMHLHYKGFRIVPVSRTVFNGFIASAVVRARHGSRHVEVYFTEHSSGELARFDTADEAFGCAVDWGFLWVDQRQ